MRLKSPWKVTEIIAGLALLGVGLWSVWPLLASAENRWAHDARYSHGYLVPLFAAFLLYWRRDRLPESKTIKPSLLGLPVLMLGASLQIFGGYVGSEWVASLGILAYLCSAALIWGGLPMLRWSLPSVLFLIFMIPLPWRLEVALGGPLQSLATGMSTYALQTIGLMAFAQGNIIRLGEFRIGVVEACSGLSMLMTFFAVSTAAALISKRPLLDRMVLALSAIPVALISNTARIVLTGVLFKSFGAGPAEHFYHDLAGWVMIPFALLLLWVVLRLWSLIVADAESPEASQPIVVGLSGVNASGSVDLQAHRKAQGDKKRVHLFLR
jgi:exosortase